MHYTSVNMCMGIKSVHSAAQITFHLRLDIIHMEGCDLVSISISHKVGYHLVVSHQPLMNCFDTQRAVLTDSTITLVYDVVDITFV